MHAKERVALKLSCWITNFEHGALALSPDSVKAEEGPLWVFPELALHNKPRQEKFLELVYVIFEALSVVFRPRRRIHEIF